MKIAYLIAIASVVTGASLKAEDRLQFGKFTMSYTPPEEFMRFDNTKTDLAEMSKAAVTSANALLAAYVNKDNALGAIGGKAVSNTPYFTIQIMKEIAIHGLKGKKPEDFIFSVYTQSSHQILSALQLTKSSELRQSIAAKAQPRAPGLSLLTPQVSSVGLIDSSPQHVTHLLLGSASAELGGAVTTYNVIATMTVAIANDMPIFIYVSDVDDGSDLAGQKIKNLTTRIRQGIQK